MEEELKICYWCEYHTNNVTEIDSHILCDECAEIYDNKTGYCSLDCCMTGYCDGSC